MTIITTDAVGPLRDIHDRMPLILPASEWAAWLDPRVDPGAAAGPAVGALVAGAGVAAGRRRGWATWPTTIRAWSTRWALIAAREEAPTLI